MAINFDKALGVHEQALQVRAQRHEVLASNIANADTPGYKARDIDFRAALQKSAQSSAGQLRLLSTQANHMPVSGVGGSNGPAELMYRMPLQPSLDGNTVESHVEQAQFADNTMRYQATLQFLSSKFSGLKTVIQGGR